MNRKKLLVMIATAATLFTGSVLASEIYRYTDENGNLHYGDRPTGAETEQRLGIVSRPTNASAVQARAEQRYARNTPEAQTAADQLPEDEVAEPSQTRAERAAAARERTEKCQMYRDRLETFVTSRRLYREGENGERAYLDESETQEARDKVQELIEETCD